MMKSTEPLEFEEMNVIAENLGEDWRDLIRQLGFSEGKLEQLEEENRIKGIKEVIYQFLLDWKQRNGEEATLGFITTLLWRHQYHWRVVQLMKENWKAQQKQQSLNVSESERSTNSDI